MKQKLKEVLEEFFRDIYFLDYEEKELREVYRDWQWNISGLEELIDDQVDGLCVVLGNEFKIEGGDELSC